MTRGIRLVAPFRPFIPEGDFHKSLTDFDWIAAIRMLQHSAQIACHDCPVHVLTDVDTELPLPTLRYVTTERRLMLWSLEVCLRYLESDDFDRDTVLVDCDQLIYRDLAPWFAPEAGVDLAVLVRPTPKHHQRADAWRQILNGVQLLAVRGRARLLPFYRQALTVARALPERLLRWGADTEALRVLLDPIEVGVHERAGLRVRMIDYRTVMEALSEQSIQSLKTDGTMSWPTRSVLDFRYTRKRWMAAAYAATVMKAAAVA